MRSEPPAAGPAQAARLLGSAPIEDEGRVLADVGHVDRVDPALVGWPHPVKFRGLGGWAEQSVQIRSTAGRLQNPVAGLVL
jgi:hypothetical protein